MPQHVDDINEMMDRGLNTAQVRDARKVDEAVAQCKEAVARFREGMDLPETLLECKTTQCRVETFRPHSAKSQDQKCPACYGTGS